MPRGEVDLLAISRGSVTAPAGCGKTHEIGAALSRHSSTKPILVLTHTNAGVAALRARLEYAGVPSGAYRLCTIDGWALRLISTFPGRSGHNPSIVALLNPKADYPSIRRAAAGLLEMGHVSDILAASYARLIVDEYQDCSMCQHSVVTSAARVLPTCVLGDPMQSIFGFGGDRLADWDSEVRAAFPPAGRLVTPWRWINAGAEELGCWLMEVRRGLRGGRSVDLRSAPASVRWVELDGRDDHKKRLAAASVKPPGGQGCVLIIGDSKSPRSHQSLAGQTRGAVTVEAVDLRDLVSFAASFDITSRDALKCVVGFAEGVMTNVRGGEVLRRVEVLARGTARKTGTDVERLALAFVRTPTHGAAASLLAAIGRQVDVRTYRPTIARSCIKALQLCESTDRLTFPDAARQMREQYRFVGRPLPRRAVGSTLLLKGLEADVAVVLNADALDARNLYVAITRGSRALTVCSRAQVLDPR